MPDQVWRHSIHSYSLWVQIIQKVFDLQSWGVVYHQSLSDRWTFTQPSIYLPMAQNHRPNTPWPANLLHNRVCNLPPYYAWLSYPCPTLRSGPHSFPTQPRSIPSISIGLRLRPIPFSISDLRSHCLLPFLCNVLNLESRRAFLPSWNFCFPRFFVKMSVNCRLVGT